MTIRLFTIDGVSLCPEADERAAMSDAEFWDRVAANLTTEPYEYDPNDEALDPPNLTAHPCPVCGAAGACGYDAEGRAMIHALATEDPDDEGEDD